MDGRNAAAEDQHNSRMHLAWHIEALARQKKLPKFEKLLRRQRSGAKKQGKKKMLATMRAWVAATNKPRGQIPPPT